MKPFENTGQYITVICHVEAMRTKLVCSNIKHIYSNVALKMLIDLKKIKNWYKLSSGGAVIIKIVLKDTHTLRVMGFDRKSNVLGNH